jgi:hypothetical protein
MANCMSKKVLKQTQTIVVGASFLSLSAILDFSACICDACMEKNSYSTHILTCC